MTKNRTLPLLLALASAGMLAAPAPVATARTEVGAPVTRGNDRASPPPAPVTAAQIKTLLGNVEMVSYRNPGPVWLGSAKRGARLGRSRWNYNR